MSQLGDNLKNAAAYEVAKVATDRKVALADDDIDALAAQITSVVLEELTSRELHGRELASRDETTNTWAEHSVRIDEYAEAARDLRFAVSGEDRSEPTPAPRPCPEKGINHDTRAVLDCELPAGHDGWHQAGDSFWRVGAPAHVLAAAKAEVVTPEGPA